jgi:zinc transport system substrate-binding protein
MSRTLRRACIPCLLAVCLVHGCSEPVGGQERPLVVVSVAPQRFVVERLAGPRVDARVLVPPAASPALYEPTLPQLRAISRASLYVKVGHPDFPFERSWLDRLLAESPDLRVVDCSAGLELRGGDPHVWLVPRHVAAMSEAIAKALAELLPAERSAIESNAAAFAAEIADLDRELREILAERRGDRFWVFHPAWGYFADEYGLEQEAVERDHKAPGVHDVAELIERARRSDTRTLFVQPQFDRTSAEVIAREIGADVEVLDPLAYDWPANLRRSARLVAESATP